MDFFSEDVNFKLPDAAATRSWLQQVLHIEGGQEGELNYIFCSDDYLHKMNRQYLNHDTYTDIITFGYSEYPEALEGDIYISIDRVEENARNLGVSFDEELHRVMVHGLLHLLGYGDKDAASKQKMREKEDACLSLR